MRSERDAFLQARQRGLGGSDIGAILGISPFKTAVDVFLDKTNPHPKDIQTELTRWGQALEPVIAQRFAQDHGMKVIRPETSAQHPQHPWMIAHLDGIIVHDTPGVLEVKNVNAFGAKAWGNEGSDEVPLPYVAQCAWYMAIKNYDYAVIAALFGGNDYREFRLERDRELEQHLIEKGQAFWFNHVLARCAPEATSSHDLLQLLKHDNGQSVEASDALFECYTQRQSRKAQIKQLEHEIEQLELQIKTAMGEAATLTWQGQTLATWKTQNTRRFDLKAFEAAHPDLSATFRRTCETRVLRLK